MCKWVTATKVFSAILSILFIYVVFVRGFSFIYWSLFLSVSSGSGSVWIFYLNFYQLTVYIAFQIVLVILLLRYGRKLWNEINDRYIPPYEKEAVFEIPLPALTTDQSHSTKRSLQMMVYFFLLTIGLSVSLIYIDTTLGLLYSQTLQTQIRAVSDQFIIAIIAEIIQIPLNSFDTTPIESESDAALFITVVHIWVPAIPLSLFLINLYSFSHRVLHLFLFRLLDKY